MRWRRRRVELAFPERNRLRTSLDGVDFDARVIVRFVPSRKDHFDRESLVRTRVVESASNISRAYAADDLSAAQAAINAELGCPSDCADGYYRRLTAKVELGVSADAARAAAQNRKDAERVARLRHLRSVLYTDPGLLAVDHLDRNPGAPVDRKAIREYYAIANHFREAEEWWSPLMLAWSELATEAAGSPNGGTVAMDGLLEAINNLNARLAARHSVPRRPSGG
ncbi:hypothetical protein AB0E63_17515 [Kribbella sp. NPDC026596]|uniref:hypothetical protein n=1 Tax=Kribbella sp. NPDC026596 TaxID=3155122 RepID=UPI0033E5CCB7